MLSRESVNDLLKTLFPTWVYWAAFVFTTAGCIYSAGKNLPWTACLFLLPLLIALVDRAYHLHLDLRASEVALERTVAEKQQISDRLHQFSSESLAALQAIIERSTVDACFASILNIADYLSRLQLLENTTFSLRRITPMGEAIYFAVRVPAESFSRLREADPFVLYSEKHGAKHAIAALRVSQLSPASRTFFLKLESEIAQDLCRSLWDLTRASEGTNVKGFGVRPMFEVAPFAGKNMREVQQALVLLRDMINNQQRE